MVYRLKFEPVRAWIKGVCKMKNKNYENNFYTEDELMLQEYNSFMLNSLTEKDKRRSKREKKLSCKKYGKY